MDLRRWDHREMCKVLIALALAEPGENWVNEEYRWSKYDDVVPGWILPQPWTIPDEDNGNNGGPRKFGWVTLTFKSSGVCHLHSTQSRRILRRHFLSGLRQIA